MMGGKIETMQRAGGRHAYERLNREATVASSMENLGRRSGQYAQGPERVFEQAHGRAFSDVGGIDAQKAMMEESLGREVTYPEFFQRTNYGQVSFTSDTGSRVTAYIDPKTGYWGKTETAHGTIFKDPDGDLVSANLRNYNLKKALEDRASLQERASEGISRHINWGEMYTDSNRFQKSNNLSNDQLKEADSSLRREVSQILYNEKSLNDQLSEGTKTHISAWTRGEVSTPGVLYGVFGVRGTSGGDMNISKDSGHSITTIDGANAKDQDALNRLFQKPKGTSSEMPCHPVMKSHGSEM